MTEHQWDSTAHGPCSLELSLCEAETVCGMCGAEAWTHSGWMKRRPVPFRVVKFEGKEDGPGECELDANGAPVEEQRFIPWYPPGEVHPLVDAARRVVAHHLASSSREHECVDSLGHRIEYSDNRDSYDYQACECGLLALEDALEPFR